MHRVRADVTAGDPPRPLEHRPVRVAILRLDRRMRHLELDPAASAILAAFGTEGATLDVAVEAALAVVGDPAALAASLGPWFARFTERGLPELAT